MKNSMLFFDTMLFVDDISVNQLFLKNRVKKLMTLLFLASSEIRGYKFLTLCPKNMHHPSVRRFNGFILWYVFDYQNKSGDDATKL